VKVQSGKESAFEDEARKMVAYVAHEEPDTTFYVCQRSMADPTVFVFYEEYATDDALTAHGGSGAIKAFFGAVGGLLDGPPSIETFRDVAGKR
jgi:quinol monooxygenase YgiN